MATYYVTVAGAGDNSGSSWANAMADSDFFTYYTGTMTAGDIVYIAGGTYTRSSNLVHNSAGTSLSSPVKLIGVNSGTTNEPPTVSDWATDTNRPLISLSTANTYISIGNYFKFFNIRLSGARNSTTLGILQCGDYCTLHNSLFNNTNSGVTNVGVSGADGCIFNSCEFQSGNSAAFGIYTSTIKSCVNMCYFNGTGIYCTCNSLSVMFSVFDTCNYGVHIINTEYNDFINNTFYACTTGIRVNSVAQMQGIFLNNIFSDCTDGFKADFSGTAAKSMHFDYNNWYNNTRDMSWDDGSTEDNSVKGDNALAVDPNFSDAANGDFRLLVASSLIDAGLSLSLGVG